eukprot:1244376-Alexandrium_andersonii.AAC.1
MPKSPHAAADAGACGSDEPASSALEPAAPIGAVSVQTQPLQLDINHEETVYDPQWLPLPTQD